MGRANTGVLFMAKCVKTRMTRVKRTDSVV